MRTSYHAALEKYRHMNRKRKRIICVLCVLSLAVASFVGWSLRYTGTAQTTDYYCGLQEHIHNESCYELQTGFAEGQENQDEAEESLEEEQQEPVSDETVMEKVLICGLEEHVHSEQCTSNPEADVVSAADLLGSVSAMNEEPAENFTTAALSQVGVSESVLNFQLRDGVRKGYSRYGDYFSSPYADWNLLFIQFCADVSGMDLPVSGTQSIQEWVQAFTDTGEWTTDLQEAVSGDLVFISMADQTLAGILVKEEDSGTVIAGDVPDTERDLVARLDLSQIQILGFGLLHPKEPEPDAENGILSISEDLPENSVDQEVTNFYIDPDEVYLDDLASLVFSFTLTETVLGSAGFQEGEVFTFETDVTNYFDISEVTETPIRQTDENGNEVTIATVRLEEGKIVVTMEAASQGMSNLNAYYVSIKGLKPKDLGQTPSRPVTVTVKLEKLNDVVTFLDRDPTDNGGSVDIDQGWLNSDFLDCSTLKNGHYFEINPIGSMDLYGSTTYPGRKPTAYDYFMVRMVIPGEGIIDESSMQIYAAIPVLTEWTGNAGYPFGHGYYLEPGVFYAQRWGTMRYSILSRLTRLYQLPDETYAEYESRVRSQSLSWGIYQDASTNTQTFLCNFGPIGNADPSANNGILYTDYSLGQSYAKTYPEIFGTQGASGGGIVSYYVEFQTFYPQLVSATENVTLNFSGERLYQTASGTTDRQWNTSTVTFNPTTCTAIGEGLGQVTVNHLTVKLVDEADLKTPIPGAQFKIQVLNETTGTWEDTALHGTTNSSGFLVRDGSSDNTEIGILTDGTYRVVQMSSSKGFTFNNDTYSPLSGYLAGTMSTYGEFTVVNGQTNGFAALVTNYKTYILPSTGGMGTRLYTMGGLAVFTAGAAGFGIREGFRRKRRKG